MSEPNETTVAARMEYVKAITRAQIEAARELVVEMKLTGDEHGFASVLQAIATNYATRFPTARN